MSRACNKLHRINCEYYFELGIFHSTRNLWTRNFMAEPLFFLRSTCVTCHGGGPVKSVDVRSARTESHHIIDSAQPQLMAESALRLY